MGLGARKELNDDLILPDMELTINQGAIAPLGKPRANWTFNMLKQLIEVWGYDFDTPIGKIEKEHLGDN